MIKIAINLLLSRKKWLCLIVGSIALMLAGTMSIISASEIIKSNIKEAAYKSYGEHTGVLMGLNASKKEVGKKVDRIGEYAISDAIPLENKKKITVGWFDKDAIQLGRIQLKQGVFPKTKNEIVIEESYKKLLDQQFKNEWQIGESKSIDFNNGQRKVVLVGIIKDYSSNWSVPAGVKKGENDFPNIITVSSNKSLHNYLFKIYGSNEESINKSTDLITEYGEGYINQRLFYKGLKDYDTISTVSFIFQYLVLVMSLLIIITLISFYNINEIKKLAILKAIGADVKNLIIIKLHQYLIMLGLGFLCSFPLTILFIKILIKNTYDNGGISNVNWTYIIILNMLILFLVVLFLGIKNLRDLEKFNTYSISSLIKGIKEEYKNSRISTNNFAINQLLMQIMNYKKLSILATLTLCFTLLLPIMSIFIQKETEGIWDDDVDYYISAQEMYYSKNVDNMVVLKEDGLTISEADAKRIEDLPYVYRVEKNPFMVDVHLLIDKTNLTQPIENWINNNNSNAEFDNKLIIPNVKYRIIDSTKFEEMYPNKSFEDFKRKAILIIPNSSVSNKSIINKEILFARKYNEKNGFKTKIWSYHIYDVIDDTSKENKDFIILLDSESATRNGIFRGYYDLSITIDDNIKSTQKNELEKILSNIVSTTPGSLYQNVSEFKEEDTKISVMFGFLGKFSFIITLLLSIIGILNIIIGKYNLQRIHWGIYMSLGMNKRRVLKHLSLEIVVYLVVGSLLSGLIFFFMALYFGHHYPLFQYFTYYIPLVGFVSLLLLVGIYFIKLKINGNTILSLLRRED